MPGVVTSAVPAAHVTCAGGAGRREQEGARAALQGTAAMGREAEVGKEKSDNHGGAEISFPVPADRAPCISLIKPSRHLTGDTSTGFLENQ